jgi:hypothetical protein
MSVPHHETSGTPPAETRQSLGPILSALLGGAACGLLVADVLASPILVGWVLLTLAVGLQLVLLLRRPRSSPSFTAPQPPLWFWLALLVMVAFLGLMRLFLLI